MWAAAAVELTPKKAPAVSPCSDNPTAAAVARIAGGASLFSFLWFTLGSNMQFLGLQVWTCHGRLGIWSRKRLLKTRLSAADACLVGVSIPEYLIHARIGYSGIGIRDTQSLHGPPVAVSE